MSTPTEGGPLNGHLSSYDTFKHDPITSRRARSDSALSETPHEPGQESSPAIFDDPRDDLNHTNHSQDQSESDIPSPANASDDAEFDMQESLPSQHEDVIEDVQERPSSSDSNRAPKRKAAVVEDDFMRADPELYGLRRSRRPQPQRQIVDTDDSESDVAPTKRRETKRRRVDSSRQSSKRPTPSRQLSTNDSDSDSDDVYGGARAKRSQKKARLQRESQTGLTEKRWSSRAAASKVQQGAYEESDFEDDEDEAGPAAANYTDDYVDNSPYIEKIVKHKLKDGVELAYDVRRQDFEYFVKWQYKSHLHDSWETIESLRHVRGIRKVENYYKKFVEQEMDMRFGYDIPPETKEQFFLDRERDEEAFQDYTNVERVVAVRDGEDETEYFVKWKGLTYEECTWEVASDISSLFQDKIDQYLDRASRSWLSDRRETNLDTRARMTKLDRQPDYIQGGELRQFQLKGLNFLSLNWTRGNNVILADEMGLGKTVQSVSFLSWLRNERGQEGPSLVVAPLSVIPAWCDTFNHWSPDLNYVVYLGPEDARNIIREHELLVDGNPKKPKFNVLVTSYEFILQDWQFLSSIKWQTLLVDEAHRLKNKESQLYARLLNFGVPCKVLITGTPIQNNLAELSALLDFLNPGKVNIDEDLDSLSATDAQEKLQELHSAIAPYIIRRTKETVESDLPPKTEKIIRVELSDVQLEYYKNILTKNYAALSDANNGHKNSLLNVMMELKKVSNHPYMFAGAEERVLGGSVRREDQIKGLIASSGKMMLLDQLLSKLKRDGHRVLIFSQMVKMLDILGDYLSLRGYKFQRLDGTIAAGPRRMAINHFNADDSDDFCFLLSTRAGGLGINLMTADTVVIFDSDWNPQADLQAMARAHRIGQKRPVNIYRLVSKETVEEEVLERARNKLLLEYLTIQAGVTDDGKAQLKEELNKKGVKTDGPSSNEDIQMVLKMRSSKMFEQKGNQERLEQLDIDSILENAEVTKTKVDDKINLSSGGIDWDSFMQITDVKVDDLTLDWDQIIPAEKIAEMKAEEDKRRHEAVVAELAAESAPRRATMKNRNKETDQRADRVEKRRKEQEQEAAEKRAAEVDPNRPLGVKEQRVLIKAFFRFGSFENRGSDITQASELTNRAPEVLKSVLDDFIKAAQDAVDEYNAKVAEEEKKLGKALNKKDRKAVLIKFGELSGVNALTAIERPAQLQTLRQAIKNSTDWRNFRLSDATKAASYSCPWGAKEDAMLLVGIDRHGFGAWPMMRDDPELGLQDKLFLDEQQKATKEIRGSDKQKAPGPVHLVRRAEYLLSLVHSKNSTDQTLNKPAEQRPRNKKQLLTNGHRSGAAASPAPLGSKKRRDKETSYMESRSTPRPDQKRKHASNDDGRSPKHRRVDEDRRPSKHGEDRERIEKRRHRDDDDRRNDKHRHRDDGHHHREDRRDDRRNERRDDRHGDRRVERRDDRRDHHRDDRRDNRPSDHHRDDRRDNKPSDRRRDDKSKPYDERKTRSLRRLDELARIGEDPEERLKDNDAMIWHLLKPVRDNFVTILSTTKETVSNRKDRATIFGDELVVIGSFLDKNFTEVNESMIKSFWDFLATLWPVEETTKSVTGERLSGMYKALSDRQNNTVTGSTRANGSSTNGH